MSTLFHIPEEESLSRDALSRLQRFKLAAMWKEIIGRNPFYTGKFAQLSFDPLQDPLENLPFTTRTELEAAQLTSPPYGTNLTYPLDHYCRFHQTSGSTGHAMRWLDTRQSWDWFKKLWGIIFRAAHVTPAHRMMFPFSFGPFVGFWAAFEGAHSLGNLAIPAGGMTTPARLKMLMDNQVDVICCTPTYALRMAEVAREQNINLAQTNVSKLIVAGEAGGSIPEIRNRIESEWNARVYDHTGMTEIGALGFECHESPGGVHLIESECTAEVIDPQTARPVPDGEPGELVLTNLGRWGSPLIRYRTNDHVRVTRNRCACGRSFARMEGGILGRFDDMITVRGNNLFPAGLEAIIRRSPEVAEFRVEIIGTGALAQVNVEVEPISNSCAGLDERVAQAIQNTLNFRAAVKMVEPGSLPRFEMKSKRFSKR